MNAFPLTYRELERGDTLIPQRITPVEPLQVVAIGVALDEKRPRVVAIGIVGHLIAGRILEMNGDKVRLQRIATKAIAEGTIVARR